MTTDSPPPPRLPTARPRARPPAGASAAATAAAAAPGDQPDEIAPTPSLIGEGPGQYLLHCENRRSFDEMKAAFDGELRPADPIERLWVDEIVDLEWDLHRLRTARRAVVETTLTENLARKVSELNKAMARYPLAGQPPVEQPPLSEIKSEARACIRGDPEAYQYISEGLGILRLEDEYQDAYEMAAGTLARLESSIHAASRLRDSILARLYGRRQLVTDGRIISGQAR